LADLLQSRAERSGDRCVFNFIRSAEGETTSLTYAELHERAMAIAGQLQSVTAVGERALLLFPPGLDFVSAFFGCLYAGVVAVPVSPLRRNRPSSSLEEILKVSRSSVVLSTADHYGQAKRLYSRIPEVLDRPWIAAEEIADEWKQKWVDPHVDGRQLAFLQFTSGSTSSPKGVMLTHENLLHNSALIQRAFGNTAESSAVIWLPLYHDMGLIGGVLQPIFCGGSSTLIAPSAFLHRPLLWLEAISRVRASVSGGPDFAYDLCARNISNGARNGLDLSCWKVAFTGAERIRANTLDRFATAFAECGFRREAFFPCYGLAEATLIVSGGPRPAAPTVADLDAEALAHNRVQDKNGNGKPASRVVGCGESLPGQQIVIVDPDTHTRCSAGQIGEIWLRGPSVARGYFDRPKATKAAFEAHLADTREGPFLRTGDLGFLREGQLFVTGRLKDLIIIRGRNYYPEDVEHTVHKAHDAFRAGHCVAFSVDVEDRESLVIVQEIEPRRRDLDTDSALRAIRQAVAEQFELEVHAIILAKAGTIPKTTSGKKRRSACRERYLGGQQDVIAHWTASFAAAEEGQIDDGIYEPVARNVTAREIEDWLIDRIAARLRIPRSKIHTTTPFLEFGMGSLDAVQIAGDMERWLGRTLSPTAVYNHPTIEALARWIASPPVPPQTRTTSVARSAATQGDPDDLLREVKGLSQAEIEALILREMAKQEGT
jgi:acyl-CoA synthetase (AMP-forming)/AMP-acid ligase II/acyl carrier protein